MSMRALLTSLLLTPAAAFGQTYNTFQALQPKKASFVARTSEVNVGAEPTLYVRFWDGDLTPEKGSVSPTFTRATERNYAQTSTLLATVSSGTAALGATLFGFSPLPSTLYLGPASKNFFWDSEDYTTANWTAWRPTDTTITCPTTDAILDPWGTDCSASTCRACKLVVAGAPASNWGGFYQDTAIAADGTAIVQSIIVKGAVGGENMNTYYVGTSAPTNPSAEQAIVGITTDWKRLSVPYTMTAGTGGNIQAWWYVKNGSTVYVTGSQIEDQAVATYGNKRTTPGPYVPTGAAEAVANNDYLTYPRSVLSDTDGTICVWNRAPYASANITGTAVHHLFSVYGSSGLLLAYNSTNLRFFYNGSVVYESAATISAGTWYHTCATYLQSAGDVTAHLFRDGVEVGSGGTIAKAAISGVQPLALGYVGDASLYGNGLYANLRVYQSAIADAPAKIFAFERGRFGK